MKNTRELFSHSATVLAVSDMMASIEFYTNKLGFTLNFTWQDPIDYAVLKRGDVGVHLSKSPKKLINSTNHTIIYVFVWDVDQVHKELASKGITFNSPLSQQEYGMKEFDILDPDGHVLTFGKFTE